MVCAVSAPALAQLAIRPDITPVASTLSSSQGELHGVVRDDAGKPLAGAVVSALGPATAFAVSDRQGRFAFRSLAAGPYLVRVHLQGYVPAKGRVINVAAGGRGVHAIALTRDPDGDVESAPRALTAGIGGTPVDAAGDDPDEHEHGEVAWRMRHLKRGVLKEESAGLDLPDDDSLFEDSLEGLGRAVEGPARLATALFAELELSGHLNLLTLTSFRDPQELFAMGAEAPRGVAYLALAAPGANGEWQVRGTMTQGDLASWIVAGSYRRSSNATHAYEAGLSYSMQRYLGGNGEALLAMRDSSRNVGAVYAYDNWALTPTVRVGYGARYARYDYLPDESLISPRASVTVKPSERDSLVFRATIAHRETAPGAEEFTAPALGLWLPPERTFSQISRGTFRPERLEHVELAAEREWRGGIVFGVRAFQQRVNDQVVTLFGLAVAEAPAGVGHYHVGSAGDFAARGWSVSASRTVGDSVRASVDYTQFASQWFGDSADGTALARHARSVLRKDERIHDVTAAVETEIAASATRFFIMYKLNTGFADANDTTPSPLRNVRFNAQVNQSLPFLRMRGADFEMLVAVSNLFRDELLDASVYDELFVVEPPKRVLGGVTVRF
jgi:hypothetical protein